jgi:hypothetical protein
MRCVRAFSESSATQWDGSEAEREALWSAFAGCRGDWGRDLVLSEPNAPTMVRNTCRVGEGNPPANIMNYRIHHLAIEPKSYK